MKKIKNQAFKSLKENTATFDMYVNAIIELALSVFTWENLPESIDTRYIETTLLYNGAVVFFKDCEMGMLALPTTYNHYGITDTPTNFNAYSVNGYNNTLDVSNAVLCYSNYTRVPMITWVNHFAYKLYEIDRTYDTSIRSCKVPLFIGCTEKERLSYKNMYLQYDGNEPIIYATEQMNPEKFKVLRPQTDFISDKIRLEKTATWNECLEKFGIPTYDVKRERSVTSEIETAKTRAVSSVMTSLKARQDAVEKINRMFGTSITVKYNYESED